MEDSNEEARVYAAGATVRHNSPFGNLLNHKNEAELSDAFIKKWVIPFYMQIGSYGDGSWIEAVKEIKNEIKLETCLLLLGDFNWRTRLVGAYFAAVKGYEELVDIIGIHLLRSEVCCVGHVYAVVLAFFNTTKSADFLCRYLEYYLTKPALYFDQAAVMEAIFYLDDVYETNNFGRHIEQWNLLNQERKLLEKQAALKLVKFLEKKEGKEAADNYLQSFLTKKEEPENFVVDYFEEKIAILRGLNQYNG